MLEHVLDETSRSMKGTGQFCFTQELLTIDREDGWIMVDHPASSVPTCTPLKRGSLGGQSSRENPRWASFPGEFLVFGVPVASRWLQVSWGLSAPRDTKRSFPKLGSEQM